MSRHEPGLQFTVARSAAASPVGFTPRRDRWAQRGRWALVASATIGFWALLLAPGGQMLG